MTRRTFLASLLPLTFPVPAHACDCHTHIFGQPSRFPLFPGRTYTPEPASPAEMRALHQSLGIERVVIVQPSIYGTDNAATLYGMKARGKTARGIAVIDERTLDRDLTAMEKAGMRGIRLNLATFGVTDPAVIQPKFEAVAKRVQPLGWHIQIFTNLAVIERLQPVFHASPVPVVLDHFGGAVIAKGPQQPGFQALVDLVRQAKVHVKLSLSGENIGLQKEATPFAQALVQANENQLLWGTDWPHPNTSRPGFKPTDIGPNNRVDDAAVLNQLAIWAPGAATRKKILVDNPARLYRF